MMSSKTSALRFNVYPSLPKELKKIKKAAAKTPFENPLSDNLLQLLPLTKL
jgi:hypothetical protein